MATRFVRVDLSAARDYRPIAIEPGMALLDPANTHSKILLRWWAAWPPSRSGNRRRSVSTSATTPAADWRNRLPAGDARGPRRAVEGRSGRAQGLPGEGQGRDARRTGAVGTPPPIARATLDETNRTDLDSYFFRYRDATARSRLVWCWGFQRSDGEPAPAVVCTDPDCNLLFVRRPSRAPSAPSPPC